MGKDPAFLFYPNDWLGGTIGMTFEEKGAYMELLMMQFNRGHMTKDMIDQVLFQGGHMSGHMGGQLWGKIQDKFKTDSAGLYYNERLETEVNKRQNYCKSRANNKDGVNQYTGDKRSYDHIMTTHMSGHMENENINGIDTKEKDSKGKQFCKPTLQEVADYCSERRKGVNPNKWYDHYTSNGWLVGKNKMKDWKSAVRTWEPDENKKQTEIERIMQIVSDHKED
jgi:uncharacterized protein YdaU (DUF1376 family)